jgi:hypothetical protein
MKGAAYDTRKICHNSRKPEHSGILTMMRMAACFADMKEPALLGGCVCIGFRLTVLGWAIS